jgi:hypothetical protein
VSHLTRSRNQLWADLVAALDGTGSHLTLSEEELIAAARNTFGGSISAKTTSRSDLIASLVNAAGGSVSASTHSEAQMMAALVSALGGDATSALSSGFNASLAASVVAAEGEGGGGAPEWVPEDAKIHIDFINDRAWTEAGGLVAISTLLGTDPNTENVIAASVYDSELLTEYGYVQSSDAAVAFVGAAKTLLQSGSTLTISYSASTNAGSFYPLCMGSADGVSAGIFVNQDYPNCVVVSVGDLSLTIENIVNYEVADPVVATAAINRLACTYSGSRFEISMNGSNVAAGTLNLTDVPAESPIDNYSIFGNGFVAIKSITIYDPLPSTAGLSELSDVA